ncbi:MAG: DMP19 family protein [Prevotella sp.]
MEKSTKVTVKDTVLRQAAEAGMDEFIKVFTDAIYDFIGGELNADNMGMLNSDQITLLAYVILRDNVMDGGFVELIHNGYGGFIFLNPFGKAVREWGLQDLYKIVRKCHRFYMIHHESIEKDCTQEEFDALYEQFPVFDGFDDAFVESEEDFTSGVAHYVDEHIDNFATIVNE